MVIDSNFFMDLALKRAWEFQLLTYPNPAVGAVVVKSESELLAIDAHQQAGGPHAEVLALQNAYYKLTGDQDILALNDAKEIHKYLINNHNDCFSDCTLYVTLEPCAHEGKTPSCAVLISSLGIKKVVIATSDKTDLAKGGEQILLDAGTQVEYSSLGIKGDELLYPFLRWSQERFIFFKWAQRLDGTIDGGIISSKESRTLVHAMRGRCDLIVVGGNTIRSDRPTLDARLVGMRAPDVLIISREKKFDQDIPLFHVKNRKVMIEDNFQQLKNYNCIMIEGGSNMFELCKKEVDYHLSFVSPKSGGKIPFVTTAHEFEILHAGSIADDMLLWMRLKG
jgi:diaminohydroxyphosphoribosylaminopyrimidine deaminase / 5-amino-6-(5-phosphoribosylamino)uracil reductase